MPTLRVPNSASLHAARHFLSQNDGLFDLSGVRATIAFHPRWSHMEPFALTMAAAWGLWCVRSGFSVEAENEVKNGAYFARMGLFEHLGLQHEYQFTEHEPSGRFLPVRRVRSVADLPSVIADISALLHLDDDPETLAAVQYCVSELIRNSFEHSGSEDDAIICAQRYQSGAVPRVSIAVADCGMGIRSHLSQARVDARESDARAIHLALQPGVTGAIAGPYGTPDNAGAGLFITRCIAKGSGGYFLAYSGDAAYRMRRESHPEQQTFLFSDPFSERHDMWQFDGGWQGTVVAVEIRTDHISDFAGYFEWIRDRVPPRKTLRDRIRFS